MHGQMMSFVRNGLKNCLRVTHQASLPRYCLRTHFMAKTPEFKEYLKSKNTTVWHGPPGMTDVWQPVDAGAGKMMKDLIAKEYDLYMADEDNLDRWEKGTIPIGDRRILITQWVGKAYEKLCTEQEYIHRLFQRTSCLITADGTDDELIHPEGFPNDFYLSFKAVDWAERETHTRNMVDMQREFAEEGDEEEWEEVEEESGIAPSVYVPVSTPNA